MSRAREFATQGNNAALVLNSSAASTDVGENLLLEGTDSSSTDAGYHLLQEKYGTHVPYDQLEPGNRPQLHKDTIWFRTWFGYAGTQSISHATVTTCAYDKVVWDYNGNANMAADPAKFTCTVPGIYWFKISNYLTFTAHASVHVYAYAYINREGKGRGGSSVDFINQYHTHGYGGGSGFNIHNNGTHYIEGIGMLAAGDTIECKVYQYKHATAAPLITTYAIQDGFTGLLLKRLDNF